MLVNKPTLQMNFRLTTPLAPAPRAGLTLAFAALFAACGGPTPPAESPATAAPVYVGSIASVDGEKKSVTISTAGEGSPPDPGTELTAIAPSGEATRLKVTSKAPRVSATVVSGSPKRGQRVYR